MYETPLVTMFSPFWWIFSNVTVFFTYVFVILNYTISNGMKIRYVKAITNNFFFRKTKNVCYRATNGNSISKSTSGKERSFHSDVNGIIHVVSLIVTREVGTHVLSLWYSNIWTCFISRVGTKRYLFGAFGTK